MSSLVKKTLIISVALAMLLSLAIYLMIQRTHTKPTAPGVQDAATASVTTTPPPAPARTEKPARPAVQRILFAGDSMMQGIAPIMMRQLQKTHPDWMLRNESEQSTGLTVKRRVDWVQKIKTEVVTHRLTTVVVFLGPNDPWDIYERRQVIRFPSPEWEALYDERVNEICKFAKSHNVHVIWVGLPVMKENRVLRGAIVQNPIFRDNMKRHGFDFVSTETLIGRVDQPYARHITDETGEKINVRADDGIHFSPQGLQRIAAAVLTAIDPPDEHSHEK
jgi:hypothetical protein